MGEQRGIFHSPVCVDTWEMSKGWGSGGSLQCRADPKSLLGPSQTMASSLLALFKGFVPLTLQNWNGRHPKKAFFWAVNLS